MTTEYDPHASTLAQCVCNDKILLCSCGCGMQIAHMLDRGADGEPIIRAITHEMWDRLCAQPHANPRKRSDSPSDTPNT